MSKLADMLILKCKQCEADSNMCVRKWLLDQSLHSWKAHFRYAKMHFLAVKS